MSLGAQVDGADASASSTDRQESEDAPQHQERSLVAPISLCLICKDNISTLERCIRSARPFVAETCVYDTGSQDGTIELLDSLASEPGTPIRIERGEWRDDFAWARNQSFAMADPALPWRMYVDSDDEMVAGEQLVEVVREMERTNAYGALSAYFYDFAATGDEGEVSTFLRIMRTDSGSWRGRVHECWAFREEIRQGRQSERIPELVVVGPPLRVLHHRHEHDTYRYMPLMLDSALDHERSPRVLYFIAGTLYSVGEYADALRAAQLYLETVDLDEGPWSELHSGTLSYVLGCAAELGRDDLAVSTAEEIVDYLRRWTCASRLDPDFIAPPSFGANVSGKAKTDEELIRQAEEILESTRELAWARGHRPSPMRRSPAPGRNEKCPCGSGLKSKRCCFA